MHRSNAPPVDLSQIRHFPAVHHSVECPFWNGALPGTVLCKQDVVACLHVYDPDERVVGREEVDHLRPDFTAEVCRIPYELFAGPEKSARLLACGLNDSALVARALRSELVPDFIQRNPRTIRKMLSNPGILSGTRKTRHHRHTRSRILVRQIVGIAARSSKINKAAVGRWKSLWTVQAIVIATEFAKQSDICEQISLVATLPAQRICLRQQRE